MSLTNLESKNFVSFNNADFQRFQIFLMSLYGWNTYSQWRLFIFISRASKWGTLKSAGNPRCAVHAEIHSICTARPRPGQAAGVRVSPTSDACQSVAILMNRPHCRREKHPPFFERPSTHSAIWCIHRLQQGEKIVNSLDSESFLINSSLSASGAEREELIRNDPDKSEFTIDDLQNYCLGACNGANLRCQVRCQDGRAHAKDWARP